jgi:hypothetical protein
MGEHTETVEGYVMSGGCIRRNARDELLENARTHTQDCALMGHCLESGYGIVTEDDQLVMLDPEATRQVVDSVEATDIEEGIRLHVTRESEDGRMETTDVEDIS